MPELHQHVRMVLQDHLRANDNLLCVLRGPGHFKSLDSIKETLRTGVMAPAAAKVLREKLTWLVSERTSLKSLLQEGRHPELTETWTVDLKMLDQQIAQLNRASGSFRHMRF